MFETTLSGIVIIALGGITFLAYHHPKEYVALGRVFINLILQFYLCLACVLLGFGIALYLFRPFLEGKDLSAQLWFMKDARVIWLLFPFAVSLYLFFLWYLTNMLNNKNEQGDDQQIKRDAG